MLGWHGNGCSVVVSAESVWVGVVLGCPETIPPGPKTIVLLLRHDSLVIPKVGEGSWRY